MGSEGLQIDPTTWPLTPAQETAKVALGGLEMPGFGNGAAVAVNVSSPLPLTGRKFEVTTWSVEYYPRGFWYDYHI